MTKTRNSLITTFALLLSVTSLFAQNPIPISEAREQALGTTVTVTGHVTVTEEFAGPVYFQDETGGIAWFNFDLMRGDNGFNLDVNRGDSIVITGELGEFNDLIQIVGDNVQYEFFPEGSRNVQPTPITVSELESGDYEGQLVSMDVDIIHSGAFQPDEYTITDRTGSGVLYINDDTEVIGATAPEGITTIVGVVGIFNGTFQLLPRDLNDIDAKELTYPGEEVSKDRTFEVATWNIEWFGSESQGPGDEAEQMENVTRVINEVDADLYAFQEISSSTAFSDLIAGLEGYGGFMANFSQTQKTAFIFKRATIDSLDSGMITTGMTQSNWANGRYPLFFRFNVTIEGESREIYAYNIHAKAFDDLSSYEQRVDASRELKLYLDNERGSENVIFLGDYNDTITGSITAGEDSPYDNFNSDTTEYTILTKSLEERGFQSQASGSFIDHITITSELSDEYVVATERVENTSYIGSYLSSTSDHYPIWTRFQFTTLVSNEEETANQPAGFSLEQNYPNPFNPTTQISYQLSVNSFVQLEVFDVMGRKVATLVNRTQSAGQKTVTFDAGNLSSGVYIYRLSTANGEQLTKKMMLIK